MVATRASQKRGKEQSSNHSKIAHYALEQERQLKEDRAMIAKYRKDWQEDKGILHAVFT